MWALTTITFFIIIIIFSFLWITNLSIIVGTVKKARKNYVKITTTKNRNPCFNRARNCAKPRTKKAFSCARENYSVFHRTQEIERVRVSRSFARSYESHQKQMKTFDVIRLSASAQQHKEGMEDIVTVNSIRWICRRQWKHHVFK